MEKQARWRCTVPKSTDTTNLWERGVNMSVEARCQSCSMQCCWCPVSYLHSGVVSGRGRRSSIGFDVFFEQSEPQVHLFLAGTVDDDGIEADPCDMSRKGKCDPSSAFSWQGKSLRIVLSLLPCGWMGLCNMSNKCWHVCDGQPHARPSLTFFFWYLEVLEERFSHTQLSQEGWMRAGMKRSGNPLLPHQSHTYQR